MNRVQERGTVVQFRVLGPAEKLLQFAALLLQVHHLRAHGDDSLTKHFVSPAHGIDMQAEPDEEQPRNDAQDARSRKKSAVRLEWLRR